MVNEQLIGWIRENNSKGYDLQQLKDILAKGGYPQSDIDEAISMASAEVTETSAGKITISPAEGEGKKPKQAGKLGKALGKGKEILKDKKNRKMLVIIGGAGLGLLLLAILLILWPRGATIEYAAPPIQPAAAPAMNLQPDNYSFVTETKGNLILEEKGDTYPIEISAASRGEIDVKNKKSHTETKVSLGLDPRPPVDIQVSSYLLNDLLYQRMIGGDLPKDWVKVTPQDITQGYKISSFFGLNAESLEVQSQMGTEGAIANLGSNATLIDKETKHYSISADRQIIAEISKKMFEKVAVTTPVLSAFFNINNFEYDYNKALKSANIEYWLDDKGRIKKVYTKVSYVFDKDNTKVKVTGFPADFQLTADFEVTTDLSLFNSIKGISLPPETSSAISSREFEQRIG